jgi:hypothetical protein
MTTDYHEHERQRAHARFAELGPARVHSLLASVG